MADLAVRRRSMDEKLPSVVVGGVEPRAAADEQMAATSGPRRRGGGHERRSTSRRQPRAGAAGPWMGSTDPDGLRGPI